jgi:sugar fermentation stimulation protein A
MGANPLVAARFVARPNRFIVRAALENRRTIEAHLADPGRLRELLVPGAELRLRPAPDGSARRTRFTVALVRAPDPTGVWVSVDTMLPNRLAEDLLWKGRVRGVGRCRSVRREVTRGKSRFDFLVLPRRGREMYVEVKSVTLVMGGEARFPDAPTKRGARHVRELTEIVNDGGRAMVLFLVQRRDASRVAPNPATDPDFAEALATARRVGVLLRAARFRLDARGRATWLGALPVRD